MTNGSRIRLAISLLAVLAAGCASAPVEMTVASAAAVEAPEGATEPAGPVLPDVQFLLLIDYHTVAPGWKVEDSAARWNELTGCELLVLPEDMNSATDYQRVEVVGVDWLTHEVHGSLWGYTSGGELIQLDPTSGVHANIAMHELGHILGLAHNDDEDGVMSVDAVHAATVVGDVTAPNESEVAEVRDEWCP